MEPRDRVLRARVTRVAGAALLPALVDAMAPVEPQLPVTTVAAPPSQRVVIREPRQPERPIEGPIVPLPEPGDYEDYPSVPVPGE